MSEESLIIDGGHGGYDNGASGGGLLEKDINLKMSLYQYKRLKSLGANVAITRTNDKTLDSDERTDLIKDKYTYCMSNHFNAFNGKARGVETIHSIHSSDDIAKMLAYAITSVSNLPFRRVFDRTNSKGKDYYFMHRLTGNTKTIIVEYGFIDNYNDRSFYDNEDNFYMVAESVIKVWCSILGVPYKEQREEIDDTIFYRVIVGSFNSKDNAENRVQELKEKGFDKSFIDIYKK